MAIVDTRYSAVLPPQGNPNPDKGAAGIAGGQIPLQQGYATNTAASAAIDWSSLGETGSQRAITINTSADMSSGETLDVLVNSILSHIGSRAPV